MLELIKEEGKILAVSVCIGMLLALGVAAFTYVYSETTQRNISENVIRFHVMAHSDNEEDQALKDHVSKELLEHFAETLSTATDIESTRATLTALLPEFQEHAENVIREAGFNHSVTANMSTVFFPTQFYGNIAFPSGKYEAVQITIGNGEGQNWWCLMFPPLCYVDMTATEESRQILNETISEEGFRLLMHQEEKSPELAVRFRIVEWWQDRNQPAQEQSPTQQGGGIAAYR
ncbi:MAG: stage II sporulation protein R [Defluviitaleaceae bacterium]|nr:stage II sporulation protein R [Defluviitaleaceae bacterium]